MRAKHAPDANAVHRIQDIKMGEIRNQYHHVTTTAKSNRELESVMLGTLAFRKLIKVGSGNIINPTNRLVNA
jgi:hypothetical protein